MSEKLSRIEWTGKAFGKNQRLGLSKYGGFYLQQGYRDFQTGLAWQMILVRCQDLQWPGPFLKDIEVWIDVWVHGRRDVDSLESAILDTMAIARLIDNDSHVVRTHCQKHSKKRGQEDRIVIEIRGNR